MDRRNPRLLRPRIAHISFGRRATMNIAASTNKHPLSSTVSSRNAYNKDPYGSLRVTKVSSFRDEEHEKWTKPTPRHLAKPPPTWCSESRDDSTSSRKPSLTSYIPDSCYSGFNDDIIFADGDRKVSASSRDAAGVGNANSTTRNAPPFSYVPPTSTGVIMPCIDSIKIPQYSVHHGSGAYAHVKFRIFRGFKQPRTRRLLLSTTTGLPFHRASPQKRHVHNMMHLQSNMETRIVI